MSEHGDLWRPELGPELALDGAILEAAERSDAEAERIVGRLLEQGQRYEAARVLEVVAQRRLGLAVDGAELLRYERPAFGRFHRVIYDLMRAGALYARGGRKRTGEAAFRRALLFVEEAIRHIKAPERVEYGEMACLGLAFELAGHCCAALSDPEGLAYYHAAQTYWGQAARMRPEALFQWSHHPVTRTVIGCLGPVVETRSRQEAWDELFAPDYMTRLDSARKLLA